MQSYEAEEGRPKRQARKRVRGQQGGIKWLSVPLLFTLGVVLLYGIGFGSYHFDKQTDTILKTEVVVLRRGLPWLAWLPGMGTTVINTGVRLDQLGAQGQREIVGLEVGGWWWQRASGGYALWGEQLVERMQVQSRIDWYWNLGQQDQARHELITALADPTQRLWAIATAQGMLRIYPEQAQPDLIVALMPLLADEQSNIRWTTARALGQAAANGPDGAAAAVTTALLPLRHDADWYVRTKAIQALIQATSHDVDVMLTLLMPLFNDSYLGIDLDGALHQAVVRAPGTAMNGLLPLLSDPSPYVWSAASSMLSHAAAESPETAVHILTPLLTDADSLVRLTAARALGHAAANGSEATVAMVLGRLTPLLSDADPSMRLAAAEALSHAAANGSEATVTLVLGTFTPLLNDAEPSVRSVAAELLGHAAANGSEATANLVLGTLTPLLNDAEPRSIQLGLTKALGLATTNATDAAIDAAVEVLLPLLTNADPSVRAAAIEALGQAVISGSDVTATTVMRALTSLLTDPDLNVQWTAKNTLSQAMARWAEVATAAAVEILVPLLTNADPSMRGAALEALGQTVASGSEATVTTVIGALKPLLTDANPSVRLVAVEVLGQAMLSEAEVLTPVLAYTRSNTQLLTTGQIQLVKTNFSEAEAKANALIHALMPLLADPDEDVIFHTIKVLSAAVVNGSEADVSMVVDALTPLLLLDNTHHDMQWVISVALIGAGLKAPDTVVSSLTPLLTQASSDMQLLTVLVLVHVTPNSSEAAAAVVDALVPLLIDQTQDLNPNLTMQIFLIHALGQAAANGSEAVASRVVDTLTPMITNADAFNLQVDQEILSAALNNALSGFSATRLLSMLESHSQERIGMRSYVAGALYMQALRDPAWYAADANEKSLRTALMPLRSSSDPLARYWASRTLALLDLAMITHHAAWIEAIPPQLTIYALADQEHERIYDMGGWAQGSALEQINDYHEWAQGQAQFWLIATRQQLAQGQLGLPAHREAEEQAATITALAATGQEFATTVAQQLAATHASLATSYQSEAPSRFATAGPTLTAAALTYQHMPSWTVPLATPTITSDLDETIPDLDDQHRPIPSWTPTPTP